MDVSVAAVTVSVVDPLTDPRAAVISDAPVAMLVASPCVPESLLIVATLGCEELHCTDVVRSWLLPSLYLPLAVNCCVMPVAMLGLVGATAIEVSVFVGGGEAVPPPEHPVLRAIPANRTPNVPRTNAQRIDIEVYLASGKSQCCASFCALSTEDRAHTATADSVRASDLRSVSGRGTEHFR